MNFSIIHSSSMLSNCILMIKDASLNGKWQETLKLYRELKNSGAQLTDFLLFPSIIRACSNVSFRFGIAVHASLIRQGFESFTSISNSTSDFYMKWGEINSAQCVFNSLEIKDSISWNVMVHGSFSNGCINSGLRWFRKGRFANFQPNVSSLVLVIQALRDLKAHREGFVLHGYIIRYGLSAVPTIQNSLLDLYVKVDMHSARKLFDEMLERKDIVSWSVIIGGYVQSGEVEFGLQLFCNMLSEFGISPDGVTMVTVLKACTDLRDISLGTIFHGLVICRGLDCDLFVGNSLIDLYSKCFDADSAFQAFTEMPERNIVSWNLMLSGYVFNGKHLEAVSLLGSMGKEGIERDEVTFVNALQIIKHSLDPLHCKSVHCLLIRKGFESNESVMTSVIDVYAKCQLVELASLLFDSMKRKDIVAWSTMVAGFASNGKPDQAISVFKQMNEETKPNEISIINLMDACAVSSESRRSKWAHGIAIRRYMADDVAVGTAIIDMYAKCGDIAASVRAFDQIQQKNVVSYTAMISAYGMNGLAHETLALLEEMKQNDLKPNSATALSFLSACSHGGLIKEGISFFTSMVNEHGVQPGLEHYSCVIDMLARAGEFENALELIKKMPEEMKAGASAWGSILSSCRNHRDIELGSGAASRVIELEPTGSVGYLLASNVYANGGLMMESARVRKLAKERGVRVVPGWSFVNVNLQRWRFVAGDEFHPQADEIYSMVNQLHTVMKNDYSKKLCAGFNMEYIC